MRKLRPALIAAALVAAFSCDADAALTVQGQNCAPARATEAAFAARPLFMVAIQFDRQILRQVFLAPSGARLMVTTTGGRSCVSGLSAFGGKQ